MVLRHSRHEGRSRDSRSRAKTARACPASRRTTCAAGRRPAADGWMAAAARGGRRGRAWRRYGADASEHQAASDAEESRASQCIADMNPPSVPKPGPRTSPENEPEQDDRAAQLDELLARADQAAQRIAAQQAERQASSEYAARMELEALTQAEAGQQAEVPDEVELELLRRGATRPRVSPLRKERSRSRALRQSVRPWWDGTRTGGPAFGPLSAPIPAKICHLYSSGTRTPLRAKSDRGQSRPFALARVVARRRG